MRKPRIFIASSSESLYVANAFQVNLDHQTEVTVWKHGFALARTTIESLVEIAKTFDFAIFIFTPDDVAIIREKEQQVTRDNVIFELGLFTGSIGRDRCFIVKPRDIELHIPSDLLGLTPVDYDGNRSDGNIEAAINYPSSLIKKRIMDLGLISKDLGVTKQSQKKVGYDYRMADIEHHLLAKIFEYSALSVDGVAVDRVFDQIKDVERSFLSLTLIKLERLGYVDKSIVADNYYEYFSYSITADGIDYFLENEDLLKVCNQKTIPPKSTFGDFEDEIPF